MTIQPLSNRVAIEPLKKQDEVVNGIFIPSQQLGEGVLKGTVLAVGPAATVKKGDIVAYGKYGFDEMRDGLTVLHVLPEELILAVVLPDAVVATAG